jgi:hypothetical protein
MRNPVFFGKRMEAKEARKYAREHDLPFPAFALTATERKRANDQWKDYRKQRRAELKAWREKQKKEREAKVIVMPKTNSSAEARELRALGKRLHLRSQKNLFGFGKGTSHSAVEGRRRKEAHRLLDEGHYGEARRVSKMSTRRYAKKRGIKVEGRIRTRLKRGKESARRKAHGIVDKIFGGNPTMQQKQALLDVAAKRVGVTCRLNPDGSVDIRVSGQVHTFDDINSAFGFLDGLTMNTKERKRNPLPALLSSLGSAIEQGAGYAAGAALGAGAIKDMEERKTVIRKKKATGHRPQATGKRKSRKKKKHGSNPTRRRVKSTHVVGVGRRAVFAGSKSEAANRATLLRSAGARRVRVKRIPAEYR